MIPFCHLCIDVRGYSRCRQPPHVSLLVVLTCHMFVFVFVVVFVVVGGGCLSSSAQVVVSYQQ